MKRIALILMLLAGFCTASIAQKAIPKDSASKSGKNSASGTTKAGNPDMRFKANKESKAKQDAQPAQAATPSPAATTNKATNAQAKAAPAAASSDKVVGKDAKGRSIYQGPKGGQYIINGSGNKEYIKKG